MFGIKKNRNSDNRLREKLFMAVMNTEHLLLDPRTNNNLAQDEVMKIFYKVSLAKRNGLISRDYAYKITNDMYNLFAKRVIRNVTQNKKSVIYCCGVEIRKGWKVCPICERSVE